MEENVYEYSGFGHWDLDRPPFGWESVTVSRRELYEAVWTRPALHLAREYGLSDRGFAKLCKRACVPTPGVGYWRKVECGKSVKRPALPVVDEDQIQQKLHSAGRKGRQLTLSWRNARASWSRRKWIHNSG